MPKDRNSLFPANLLAEIFPDGVPETLPPDLLATLYYLAYRQNESQADLLFARYREGMSFQKIGAKFQIKQESADREIEEMLSYLRSKHCRKTIAAGLAGKKKKKKKDRKKEKKKKKSAGKGTVTAYTDGSFNDNIWKWGYGVVMVPDSSPEEIQTFSGSGKEFLNNRNISGELHGVVRALDEAIRAGYSAIRIFFDYEGIQAWVDGTWKAKSDIGRWYKAYYEEASRKISISLCRVKSHSGNEYHNMADRLARKAIGL